jgi:cytochrome c553
MPKAVENLSSNQSDTTLTHTDTTKLNKLGISFKTQIEPMFKKYCTSCHNANFSAGKIDLSTYSKISQYANNSLKAIQNGSMPPSGKLNDSIINQFSNWIIQGKNNN